MTTNVGNLDRVIRVLIGLALLAWALGIGIPRTEWSWVGWIGVIPIATALFGYCPLYSLLGVSSCPTQRA